MQPNQQQAYQYDEYGNLYDQNGNLIQQGPGGQSPQQAPQAQGAGYEEMAGSLAGMGVGNAASGYMFGNGAAMATPTATGAGAATSEALGLGASAVPWTPAAGSAPMTVGAPAAAEATGLFGMGTLGSLAGAGAVAGLGAYTGHKGIKGFEAGRDAGGGIDGLKAGIKEAGWLNAVPVLGQASWIGGLVGGLSNKKHKDVRARDKARNQEAELGFRSGKSDLLMPDGSVMNTAGMGADGKSYNVDWNAVDSQAGIDEQVSNLNWLVGATTGGDSKQTSDLVGEWVNAGLKSGGVAGVVDDYRKKFDAMAQASGMSGADYAAKATEELWRAGRITAPERDARFAAIAKAYSLKNPGNRRWEDVAQLSDKERARNTDELKQGVQNPRFGPQFRPGTKDKTGAPPAKKTAPSPTDAKRGR